MRNNVWSQWRRERERQRQIFDLRFFIGKKIAQTKKNLLESFFLDRDFGVASRQSYKTGDFFPLSGSTFFYVTFMTSWREEDRKIETSSSEKKGSETNSHLFFLSISLHLRRHYQHDRPPPFMRWSEMRWKRCSSKSTTVLPSPSPRFCVTYFLLWSHDDARNCVLYLPTYVHVGGAIWAHVFLVCVHMSRSDVKELSKLLLLRLYFFPCLFQWNLSWQKNSVLKVGVQRRRSIDFFSVIRLKKRNWATNSHLSQNMGHSERSARTPLLISDPPLKKRNQGYFGEKPITN